MHRYLYQAVNAQGEQCSGEVEAHSPAHAVQQVEQLGLSLHFIQLVSSEQERGIPKTSFHQRLDELIQNRKKWLPALSAMTAELPSGAIQRRMKRMLQSLDGEMSAGQFLANEDAVALLPLLRSGLQSDRGTQQLHRWVATLSDDLEMRARRRRAYIYPIMVLLLALLLLSVCAKFLVPYFEEMYYEFGLNLPGPTWMVISISRSLTDFFLQTSLLVVLVGIAGYLMLRWWRGYALTNRLLGRWVAGSTTNLSAMSTLVSTLAELLSLEAPLGEALRVAGQSSQHAYYASATAQLAGDLQRGSILPSQSPAAKRLPSTVVHALQVGAEGQPSVALLRELARIYSDRTRFRMDWFTTALPSLAMLVIGIVVGFFVIALFMPLVSMITSLS